MIVCDFAPIALAASIYSACRTIRIGALATRAKEGQNYIEIAMITLIVLGPSAADMLIARSVAGTA